MINMLLLTILTLTSVSYVSSDSVVEFNGDCDSAGWSCDNETMIFNCQRSCIHDRYYEMGIWYKQFSPDIHHLVVRKCRGLRLYVDRISMLQLKETNREVTVENVEELRMETLSIAAGTPVMLPEVIKLQNITLLTFVYSANVLNSTNEVVLHINNATIFHNYQNFNWSDLPRLSLYLENCTVRDDVLINFQRLPGLSIIRSVFKSNLFITSVNQVVVKNVTMKQDNQHYHEPFKIADVSQLRIEDNYFQQSIKWIISGKTYSTINIMNNTINGFETNSKITGNTINIMQNNIKYLNHLSVLAKQLTISNNLIERVEDNSFDCDKIIITSNSSNRIDSRRLFTTSKKGNINWIANSSVIIKNNIITNYWENSEVNCHTIGISRNQINHLNNFNISAKHLTISHNNIELAQDNSFECDTANISSNTINMIDSRGLYVWNNNNIVVENNDIINVGKTGITITSEYVGITGNTFEKVQDQSLIFSINNPARDEHHSYFLLELNILKLVSPTAFWFNHQFYHVVVRNNSFLCRCGNLDWFKNLHTSKSITEFNMTFIDNLLSTNNDNKCLNRDCFIRNYVDHFDHLCSYNSYQPDNCIIYEQTINLSYHHVKNRSAIIEQTTNLSVNLDKGGSSIIEQTTNLSAIIEQTTNLPFHQDENEPAIIEQTTNKAFHLDRAIGDEQSVKSNKNVLFETANYTVYHQLQHQHSPSPLSTFLLVCILIALSVLILMKVKCKNIKYSHIVSWSKTNSNLQQQMNIDNDHDETNLSESSLSLKEPTVEL